MDDRHMIPQLHPALSEFRAELERLGFVVVCHGDYICIRLPLVASVRVRLNGAQLHFEPRFGMFSRGTSLVITPTVAMLAVAGVASVASVPTAIVVATAGTFTVLYDLARLVMTEGAMTRLQLLWTTKPPPRDGLVAGAPPTLSPAERSAPELPPGDDPAMNRVSPTAAGISDRLRSPVR